MTLFPRSVLSSNGGGWKFKNLTYTKMYFWPFFLENCLFIRSEMDNPPLNFSGNTMQCISIDWYPDSNTFIPYAAVNAPRSRQKAIIWSGIKNSAPSEEIGLSRYQSIDKKHFWVCVKFEVGLSILFTKTWASKKVRLFQGLSFLHMAGFEIQKIRAPFFFFLKSCLFLRTEMDNPPWTSQATQCSGHLSIDTYPQEGSKSSVVKKILSNSGPHPLCMRWQYLPSASIHILANE
jgi:hypothetical protein